MTIQTIAKFSDEKSSNSEGNEKRKKKEEACLIFDFSRFVIILCNIWRITFPQKKIFFIRKEKIKSVGKSENLAIMQSSND